MNNGEQFTENFLKALGIEIKETKEGLYAIYLKGEKVKDYGKDFLRKEDAVGYINEYFSKGGENGEATNATKRIYTTEKLFGRLKRIFTYRRNKM